MLRKCLHQNTQLEKLINALRKNMLSQSLLFSGSAGIGKSSTALYIAAKIYCKEENSPCFKCEDCMRIKNFSHQGVIFLNTDNAYANLIALEEILKNKKFNDEIFNELLFTLKDIKYRIESGYFRTAGDKNKKKKKDIEKALERIDDFFSLGLPQKKNQKKLNAILETGKFLAEQVKCDNIPTQTIRDLMKKVYKTGFKDELIIIIHGAHKMRKQASNSFLKTLEEPPAGSRFILCTQREEDILPTIKSRCMITRFNSLNNSQIQEIALKNWEIDINPALIKERGGVLQRVTGENEQDFRKSIINTVENFAKNLFNFVDNTYKEKFNKAVYHIQDIINEEEFTGSVLSFNDEKIKFIHRVNEIKSFVDNNNADKRFALETILVEFHKLWQKIKT